MMVENEQYCIDDVSLADAVNRLDNYIRVGDHGITMAATDPIPKPPYSHQTTT